MNGLVERLRAWADAGDFGRGPSGTDLRRQAADRIEKLEAALRRCADIALSIGEAQAHGWEKNPREDGCGGSLAASNTAHLIAAEFRRQALESEA